MRFSEANQEWETFPRWVTYLIRLGYLWPHAAGRSRKIALISMPCDSAAAGLIALGVLIRDLGNPNANDVGGHFDALLRFARQYLECCRDCTVHCQPEIKGCGYAAEATGTVQYKDGKRYRIDTISEQNNWNAPAIICSNSAPLVLTRHIFPHLASDWNIDGEPPAQLVTTDEGVLPHEAYDRIVEDAHIDPINLRRSYSGLCLAGRVAGKAASRAVCDPIRFRTEQHEYGLSDLLTVHEWSPRNIVSRMTFFNARTNLLDRHPYDPSLVAVDGAECFLNVLDSREFNRSDVIGVVHRTVERDILENVGNRMAGLRQWYDQDPELPDQFREAPHGISIIILARRTP